MQSAMQRRAVTSAPFPSMLFGVQKFQEPEDRADAEVGEKLSKL